MKERFISKGIKIINKPDNNNNNNKSDDKSVNNKHPDFNIFPYNRYYADISYNFSVKELKNIKSKECTEYLLQSYNVDNSKSNLAFLTKNEFDEFVKMMNYYINLINIKEKI